MNQERRSHCIGATDTPLMEITIGQALVAAVERWPDAEALVSRQQRIRMTWQDLKEAADRFAAGLVALGVGKGDRVGVWAPNCAEWTIVQFATARIGAIQVNINPAYRASELAYTLVKAGVRVLVCAHAFKSSDYAGIVDDLAPEIAASSGRLSIARFPLLAHVVKIGGETRAGWLEFDDVSGRSSDALLDRVDEIAADLTPCDPINIQFTSGTTGAPKGATLSHRNVLNNAFFVGEAMGLVSGDRLCIPVPLYHCFGMVMSNLACLVHGATMIYPSAGFDPDAVLDAIEQERCTALHGVPTMFIAELECLEASDRDLSSLRTGLMAGSPCPVEVMRKVMTRMFMRDVGIAYGMTETSPVSFQTALDDTVERRVGTIGRVQPHLEVKIVDPGSGEVVRRGEVGELCTRGYSVMLGYWDDPERTAEAIRDGWMHTGDLAVIDDDGYGSIVGRIKDMILRGGENIYPREIEEFLHTHPEVEDVQVVGVPDARFGEEVAACVKRKAGARVDAAAIRAFCRGSIAHYKVPRHVVFVDGFPLTVSGKVQKHVLRDQVVAGLVVPGADR